MATHLIEVLKRQSVRLSALGVRVLVTAAVLFGVTGFGMENARAQGQLGWPQWIPINGWEGVPFTVTALNFLDALHGVAATSNNGVATIRYILRVGTPWRTAAMPSGIDSIRAIRLIQGKFYAAAHTSDVLVSSDSGKTWISSGLGLTNANDVYADGTGKIRALHDPMKTFARLDTLHCLATGSGSIFVSSDGGITWNTSVTGADPNSAGAYADRCSHAYVCPFSPGVGVRSTDSGLTWRTFTIGLSSPESPEWAYGASNVVYFTFPSDMYRSTDDGLTWKKLVTVNDAPQIYDVDLLPHILFVFGPMGEHVILPWTRWKHTVAANYVEVQELWMTHTGGDDFLHSGINMTDSNGMDLMENDTLNMPLELTSTCNAYSIPIPFHSDVDSLIEHVSIVKDSLHNFAIIGPSTIILPRDKDVNFQLAYKPHNLVSKVVLQFDNHWHCSDWSETRTVIVTSLPNALIIPPKPITGSCKPVREAAFLQLDSCQTMTIDSVHIPRSMASRLRFDAPFPDTVRVGFNDSLFFTFDPTDTLATISDSVEIFAHYVGVDSAMVFWDFGLSGGTDSIPFSRFNRFVPVKLLAVPQVALVASDTLIALHRASFCERQLDTLVTFTNKSCTWDTIVAAQLTGLGYSMTAVSLPLILRPDSTVTFALHFGAPDTGIFQGTLDVRVVAGITKTLSIPLTGIGFPQRGILDVRSTSLQAGSISVCGGDTTLATSIANVGCDTLSISNIRVTGDAEAFDFLSSTNDTLLAPGTTKPFVFHFGPHTAGSYQMQVTFHSRNIHGSDPGLDTTITVVGIGLPGSRILSLSSSAIDIGTTHICEERDTFIVIQNAGCDTLCVNSLSLSPTGFVLASGTPSTFCLGAGERDTIRLRTAIDTTGQPLVNRAVLQLTSNADQPAPPIVLTREIVYPSAWAMAMSSADSAYPGEEIIYRVVQHGALPADVTALTYRLAYDRDLLEYKSVDEPNVSVTSGWLKNDGLMRQTILVAPIVSDSILATLHFRCFQARTSSSAITLDSVAVASHFILPQGCIASILGATNADSGWSTTTEFTLRKVCGSEFLTGSMLGKAITISGIRPNPARTEIVMSYSVDGTTAVAGTVSIEDALGREVLRTNVTLTPGANQSQALSLEGLPSGVYLLRASNGGWSSTWRVVKEQ